MLLIVVYSHTQKYRKADASFLILIRLVFKVLQGSLEIFSLHSSKYSHFELHFRNPFTLYSYNINEYLLRANFFEKVLRIDFNGSQYDFCVQRKPLQ